MRFSEMNQKQLREARNELLKLTKPILGTSRVSNLTDTEVFLEGGELPATYNNDTGELTIWGRASRCSGGYMTVSQLENVEDTVRQFFKDYLGGE